VHKLLVAQGGAALSADDWLPVAGVDCKVWSDEPLAKGEIIRRSVFACNNRANEFEPHNKQVCKYNDPLTKKRMGTVEDEFLARCR
jgi:hypothetical protein